MHRGPPEMVRVRVRVEERRREGEEERGGGVALLAVVLGLVGNAPHLGVHVVHVYLLGLVGRLPERLVHVVRLLEELVHLVASLGHVLEAVLGGVGVVHARRRGWLADAGVLARHCHRAEEFDIQRRRRLHSPLEHVLGRDHVLEVAILVQLVEQRLLLRPRGVPEEGALVLFSFLCADMGTRM